MQRQAEVQKQVGYAYVYRVTYPNGKIYVGSDTQRDAADYVFTYFGRSTVTRLIAAENDAYRREA
jgi:hypothetical protein